MEQQKKGSFLKVLIIALVVIAIMVLSSGFYVVHQNEYVTVRRFGKIIAIEKEPGLHFKVPVVDDTQSISAKVVLYDIPASDVITKDKKSMITDTYVLWKVSDPRKYVQTLNAIEARAEERIEASVYNATKNTISNMTQDAVILSRDGKMTVTVAESDSDVVSRDISVEEETEVVEITSLTEEIMTQINNIESQYGIEILTVDVKKLDLPDDNKQAVYTRMISERENIAAQYTAEGNAQAQIIRNTTDREVAITISDAEAKAEAIRAEGEAEYMRILSDAYSDESKADFYSYVRALDALKASMGSGDDTVILSEDSPIAGIFYGNY